MNNETDTLRSEDNEHKLARIAQMQKKTIKSPSESVIPNDVPSPPKRSLSARNMFVVVLNFMLTCVVFAVIFAAGGFLWGKYEFQKDGPLKSERTVVIEEGSNVNKIAEQLALYNVIDSEMVFSYGVKINQATQNMRAGEYLFKPGMSMQSVMETIRDGKGILIKLNFPEGWTVYKVFERLAEEETLQGELPKQLPPEGSLMPDTYLFQRGTTRMELVERMQRAQAEVVKSIWEKRVEDLPIDTIEEFVTLASIVEKETGLAAERPHVASVFVNRLNKGMKLQSDPTIIYGIYKGKGKPKGHEILKSEIVTPTAFNTYTIDGLPPSPICNPGKAALEAVVNPSVTEDIFFVANGSGGHVFAKTLDEHEKNVARWRKIKKQTAQPKEEQKSEAQ